MTRTGIVAWQWDFDNDGNIDSSVQNPSHTYTVQGIYDVTLSVIDPTHRLGFHHQDSPTST